MTQPAEIFERYPVAKWRVGSGAPIAFPIQEITETGGNRIVPHERPYRDGGKLDDTGCKPTTWRFRAIFNNSIAEQDLANAVLYPTVLRALIRSFRMHET